jgi:hypothetical protein
MGTTVVDGGDEEYIPGGIISDEKSGAGRVRGVRADGETPLTLPSTDGDE